MSREQKGLQKGPGPGTLLLVSHVSYIYIYRYMYRDIDFQTAPLLNPSAINLGSCSTNISRLRTLFDQQQTQIKILKQFLTQYKCTTDLAMRIWASVRAFERESHKHHMTKIEVLALRTY